MIQRNHGFFGYLNIFSPDQTIIERKEWGVTYKDLRISDPFPGLLEFTDGFDLEGLHASELPKDYKDFKLVPFPVILLKYVE